MTKSHYCTTFLLFLILVLPSCSSKTAQETYVRSDIDLGFIDKIAVLPFQSLSQKKHTAEMVRDLTITQILSDGLFDVTDKGLVDSALREEAIKPEESIIEFDTLQRLSQRLEVQAVLRGTIDHADQIRLGQDAYPELSITLRLIDASTGAILWHASGNENGASFGTRLLGIAPQDEFTISMKLVRRLIASIAQQEKSEAEPEAEPETESEAESEVEPGSESTEEYLELDEFQEPSQFDERDF